MRKPVRFSDRAIEIMIASLEMYVCKLNQYIEELDDKREVENKEVKMNMLANEVLDSLKLIQFLKERR